MPYGAFVEILPGKDGLVHISELSTERIPEVESVVNMGDEIKVMVRYPKKERRSMGNLETMNIRTNQGQEIPLKQLASMELSNSYASIQRVNRKRSVNITAEVDLGITSGNEVVTSVINKDIV